MHEFVGKEFLHIFQNIVVIVLHNATKSLTKKELELIDSYFLLQ